MFGRRQVFPLADGRQLTFQIVGERDKDLPFVFLFHGMWANGSVWNIGIFRHFRSRHSCVLVLVDRPGYGRSTRAPAEPVWTYKNFAADIAGLADHLGATTFSVIGHSSGGPNALACAAHLPGRVEVCGVLAGDPEYAHPDLPEALTDPLAKCPSWPSRVFCCCRGFENDMRTERKPYDFDLPDIACPTLFFVGSRDDRHMRDGAAFMCSKMPGSSLAVLDGAGHNGMLSPWRFPGMLKDVLEAAQKRGSTFKVHEGAPLQETPNVVDVAPPQGTSSFSI